VKAVTLTLHDLNETAPDKDIRRPHVAGARPSVALDTLKHHPHHWRHPPQFKPLCGRHSNLLDNAGVTRGPLIRDTRETPVKSALVTRVTR
jgi:hypothetical protein